MRNRENKGRDSGPTPEQRVQLNELLHTLEQRRSLLNQAAEDEFERAGNLSGLLMREEHKEFDRASLELEEFLNEIEGQRFDLPKSASLLSNQKESVEAIKESEQ